MNNDLWAVLNIHCISCYMASVLQTIFTIPSFVTRYKDGITESSPHSETCSAPLPAECVECQMRKVADGLLSGRYSQPAPTHTFASPNLYTASVPTGDSFQPAEPNPEDQLQHPSPTPIFQLGVKPTGFKALVGKGHEEFATMKQQDAEEFFTHLLTVLRRDGVKHKVGSNSGEGPFSTEFRESNLDLDPTQVFSYAMEQRLECSVCHRVRYRTDTSDVVSLAVPAIEMGKDADGKPIYSEVQLTDCIESLLGKEEVPGYRCPGGCGDVVGLRQNRFATLPEVLVVHAKKFQLVGWVPTKLGELLCHMFAFLTPIGRYTCCPSSERRTCIPRSANWQRFARGRSTSA